jgi:hypothetical protein
MYGMMNPMMGGMGGMYEMMDIMGMHPMMGA